MKKGDGIPGLVGWVHTLVVPPILGHCLVREEMMLAGAKKFSDDIIDGVLSGDGWRFGLRRPRREIVGQVIASVRLALRAYPERRNLEQLDAKVEHHPRVSRLYLKLDLVQRFASFAGFNGSLIVGNLTTAPRNSSRCVRRRTFVSKIGSSASAEITSSGPPISEIGNDARSGSAPPPPRPPIRHEQRAVHERSTLEGLDVVVADASDAQDKP